MNFLLDTHLLLWLFNDDYRLSDKVKSLMKNTICCWHNC